MRFLADMGISMQTVKWLRQENHGVSHLSEEGLTKLSDEKILEKAAAENRIILTCDLDFGFLLSRNKKSIPSVIIFRLEFQTPEQHIHKLRQLLPDYAKELEKGCIVSVEDKKIRIRELPI